MSATACASYNGQLDCLFGGDEWLKKKNAPRNSLATAYGHATKAAGFRMWRHEGKLTGLSARGEPKLRDALGRHFRLSDDGLIACDFTSWRVMEQGIEAICRDRAAKRSRRRSSNWPKI